MSELPGERIRREQEQHIRELERVAEAAQEAYDVGFVTQRLGAALAAAGYGASE